MTETFPLVFGEIVGDRLIAYRYAPRLGFSFEIPAISIPRAFPFPYLSGTDLLAIRRYVRAYLNAFDSFDSLSEPKGRRV
jgi:hypothetical protein